ncbi:MAG: hypothetical protein A2Y62_07565 [Candidatus Fischerbacteria bacterium RBG_13_37_8]|uniref:DUF4919 domain-containing protein n=1 Tax=Candidatus Fischerbacteria bacterium RBG_13_37_8 TaxID=1817863 RepID=A0A1F5VI39_9BACT|nr:MAG: hypothetical protein A2Y62_07565 [Candidatus Fischerbacteria bacterium RBG_13_37_8]
MIKHFPVLFMIFICSICVAAEDKIIKQFENAFNEANPQAKIETYIKIAKELNIKAISERAYYLSERCCKDNSFWGSAKDEMARLEIELAAAIANKYKSGIDYLMRHINLAELEWGDIHITDLDCDDKQEIFIFNIGYNKFFYEDANKQIHDYVLTRESDLNFCYAKILKLYDVKRDEENRIAALIQSNEGQGHGSGKTMLITVEKGKLVKLFESVGTDSEGCQLQESKAELSDKEQLICIEQVSYNELYWPVIYEWTDNTFKENSLNHKD